MKSNVGSNGRAGWYFGLALISSIDALQTFVAYPLQETFFQSA